MSSKKNYKNMSLEELKDEWVLEINAYDIYADKRQWQKTIHEIDSRIKELMIKNK